MAEAISISKSDNKEEIYTELIPQIESLIESETDLVANLANIAAVIKETFKDLWVGFYLVKNNELVLGPFQGPLACTRIQLGKGVCGSSWENKRSIIVEDVEKFPGHIACSSLSKSEIVVPILRDNQVLGVLDIDSEHLNNFNSVDQFYLEKLSVAISKKWTN